MKKLFSLAFILLLVLNVISFSAFATGNEEGFNQNIPKPVFITQPQDAITPVDSTVTFSFEAKNYTEIKWYMVEDGAVTDLSLNSRHEFFQFNIKENILEVKVGHYGNGTKFFAEIINSKNGMTEIKKSDEATLIFDWIPIIDIQPRITDQRLDKRTISISAKAHNYRYMRWKIDDNGQILTLKEAGDKYGFEAIETSCMCIYPKEDFTLSLNNISEEINGLKFIAVYYSFDEKSTTEANALTLNFGKLPALEQLDQSETNSNTSSTIPEEDESFAEVHSHIFIDEYKSNKTHHWKLCECGEKSEEEPHIIKNNICKKCGYILSDNTLKPFVVTIIITGGILIISALVYLLIAYKKRIFPFKKVNIDTID